jgi:peptidoglycan/LPS O-acetylase OafA/YrhL
VALAIDRDAATAARQRDEPVRSSTYRPDIDGLRAVAVLAVVAFHAFPERLPGGYAGVDVFFVISGFLISSIILRDLEAGTFSVANFYGRRVRRIFAALIVVLAATLVIGSFVLFPHEYRQLGRHVLGGAGFVSNLLLWSEAGYFDEAAEAKPLLHLWSLGIEEQFYILWPVLLAWSSRARVRLLPVSLLLFAASFVLNVVTTGRDPEAAFYSPATRLWELMAGSVLACLVVRGQLPARGAAMRSIAGAALIVAALTLLDPGSAFPGWWALLPVAGTALVISGDRDGWCNRLLSARALVWMGLISFPLYLWHWPLLSFLRIASESATPTRELRVAAVVVSVLLASLTYWFVERPVRTGGHRRLKVWTLSAGMACIAVAGLAASRSVGPRGDLPAEVERLAAFRYDYRTAYRSGACFIGAVEDARAFGACGGDGQLVLWGDSHAAHLYPGVRAFAPDAAQYTKAGCPPLVNADVGSLHCRAVNDAIVARIRRDVPARVVLAGAWHVHDWRRLTATIAVLREAGVGRIDLVGPFPEWPHGLPRTVMTVIRRERAGIPERLRSGWDPRIEGLDERMRTFAAESRVGYVSPFSVLCDARGCLTRLGGDAAPLVAWDASHLTDDASRLVAAALTASIE